MAVSSTPVGYDLWQRNPNGIAHIDSDDTLDILGKSSPEVVDNKMLFQHPPSNYSHYYEHFRKPVWQYSPDLPEK